MKEMKKFKVLKGFTIFFTVLTVIGFALYLLFNSQPEFVFNTLEKMGVDFTEQIESIMGNLRPDKTESVAMYIVRGWLPGVFLATAVTFVLQLIFMGSAFSAVKKIVKKRSPRTVQATVYVSNPKEEQAMRRNAVKMAKKDAKMKTKEEKKELKKAKLQAKIDAKAEKLAKKAAKKAAHVVVEVKEEVAKEVETAPVKREQKLSKSRQIDDILKDMQ